MKRIVAALLVFLSMIGLFSCAGEKVPATDPGDVVSATESEPHTDRSETHTEQDTSESGSATDTDTESESEQPSQPPVTEEERIRYLYEHTEVKEQQVIAWGMTHVPEYYEAFFHRLLEAGITTALVDEEYYGNGSRLIPVAQAADSVGMQLYINTFGDDGTVIGMKLEDLLEHPSVKGIYLRDEPHPITFDTLAESVRNLYERLPQAKKLMMGANLYPAAAMGGGISNYDAVKTYIEKIDPDFLCWDAYPFSSQTSLRNDLPDFLANLLQMQILADEADLPLYTFIQSCRFEGRQAPSKEQLRLLSNSALAFGSETLLLFSVGQGYPDGSETAEEDPGYLISYDGTRLTDGYYRLSEVLHGIRAMKGIYLGYRFQFADLTLCPEVADLSGAYKLAAGISSGYGEYEGITSADPNGGAILGYFSKEDGQNENAVYVVNTDYTLGGDATEYTLHFSTEQTYQIWGSGGLEAIGTGTEIPLTLLPGDGKFVVLNADNRLPGESPLP